MSTPRHTKRPAGADSGDDSGWGMDTEATPSRRMRRNRMGGLSNMEQNAITGAMGRVERAVMLLLE